MTDSKYLEVGISGEAGKVSVVAEINPIPKRRAVPYFHDTFFHKGWPMLYVLISKEVQEWLVTVILKLIPSDGISLQVVQFDWLSKFHRRDPWSSRWLPYL
jgi:hypothetical protein